MPEIVKSNPTNAPTEKPVKNHSKFQPNYSRYDTHVFGLNTPHFVMESVADDDISLRCAADVDTFNLKAPLMQPVKRNMDYFQLPLRCLLPHGAELLITNPLQGDDVDASKVNAILPLADLQVYAQKFQSLLEKEGSLSDLTTCLARIIGAYQFYSLFLSNGSLIKYLGISEDIVFQPSVGYVASLTSGDYHYDNVNFDNLFDQVFAQVDAVIAKGGYLEMTLKTLTIDAPSGSAQFTPGTENIEIAVGKTSTTYYAKVFSNLRELIGWLAVNPYTINSITNNALVDTNIFGDLSGYAFLESLSPMAAMGIIHVANAHPGSFFVTLDYGYTTPRKDINLLRALAYQMACAEFYTNDKVDGIYSGALYLSNQMALARYVASRTNKSTTYTQNGVPVEYDAHSGQFLDMMLARLCSQISSNSFTGLDEEVLIPYFYFVNLLGYTRSLKYEDYFVGSKTRPLAVGDVNVAVASNNVDIIDVTKKIQLQRFLNQVNRVGRKFSDYVKGILGDKPMKDVHEPIFLGHVVDTFGAEETDNTGEAQMSLQNSTTSKLRNNSSRYAFDVHVGEPSILIGITNYDIPRAYATVTERQNFHIDRFDMFNPYMQNVGDQEVYGAEIDMTSNEAFGYQLRHSEYKQRVDQCAGGFAAGVLPGYARVLFKKDIPAHIDSDFLRSEIYEIDQFYSVLSGYTLATHFNFIVRNDISCTANRPMSFAPSIL